MRVHSARKLFLFGRYSLALLIPKKWLSSLEAKRGDEVNLELDRRHRRIIIRFGKNTAMAEKNKELTETKPDEKTDWEPIPQL